MKKISTEDLIDYKILPYNLYSELGEKLFVAGEVLTPGKLLQLKHMNSLFRDDDDVLAQQAMQHIESLESVDNSKISQHSSTEFNFPVDNGPVIVEKFDMNPSTILRNKLSVDDIDISHYKGTINRKAKIDPQTQLKIKAFYLNILEQMNKKPPLEMLGMFANIRDKIVQDIIFDSSDIFLSSQLKLLGEYKRCHCLNTAILSGM